MQEQMGWLRLVWRCNSKAKEVENVPLVPTPSVRYRQFIRWTHKDLGEHDAEPVWERHCIFTGAWSKLSGNWQGALIPHMPSAQLNPSLWSQQRMCRIPTLYSPERRGSFPRMQTLKLISPPLPITNAVEKWGASQQGRSLNLYDL